jgi:CheY-like chemotaxis protein
MATILVIDDEPRMLRVIGEMLTCAGHTVVEATSGDQGTAIIAKQPIDLVITDIIMPEKEGIETITEIKQDHPDLPIIAISGGSLKGAGSYLSTAAALGASATLEKPFHSFELLGAVDTVLGNRTTASPA